MSPLCRHIIKIILLADVILALSLLAESKLQEADAAIYTMLGRLGSHAPEDYAQLHTPNTPVRMENTLLHVQRITCPTIHHIHWVADGADNLTALPLPKLQELATILNCLERKRSVKAIGVSIPLMWEDEQSEMAHHMLALALKGYRHVCLGLPARNAAQAEATPELLKAIAIPAHRVEGNPAALPYANTPLPYNSPVADPATVLWAPDYVEDEPTPRKDEQSVQGLSAPLLMRWKGEVLPTLPLRLALAELKLSPADVQVRIGKSIRLGKRLLPLDAQGRTPLGAARVVNLPLADALAAPPSPAQGEHIAILSRAFTPEHTARRGEQLAATLSVLLSSAEDTYMPSERPAGNMLLELNPLQSSLAGRILIAVLVVCALAGLPRLAKRQRVLILAGVGFLFLLCCPIGYSMGVWFSVCAGVLLLGLLAGAVYLLSRHTKNDK